MFLDCDKNLDDMQRLTTFTQPAFLAELFPFVFSSIEIVSAL